MSEVLVKHTYSGGVDELSEVSGSYHHSESF